MARIQPLGTVLVITAFICSLAGVSESRADRFSRFSRDGIAAGGRFDDGSIRNTSRVNQAQRHNWSQVNQAQRRSGADRETNSNINQAQREHNSELNQTQRRTGPHTGAAAAYSDRDFGDRNDDYDYGEAAAVAAGVAIVGAGAERRHETEAVAASTSTATAAAASTPTQQSLTSLPPGTTTTKVDGMTYYKSGSSYYIQAYGNSGPIYMPVKPPG